MAEKERLMEIQERLEKALELRVEQPQHAIEVLLTALQTLRRETIEEAARRLDNMALVCRQRQSTYADVYARAVEGRFAEAMEVLACDIRSINDTKAQT